MSRSWCRWSRRALRSATIVLLAVGSACQPPGPPAGWEEPYLTRSYDDVLVVGLTGATSLRVSAPWQNSAANGAKLLL